jgi:membrane associated rhomboid family serine protease
MVPSADLPSTVASVASRSRADELSLVLAAEAVPHRLEGARRSWRLVVAEEDAERALRALADYARENPERALQSEAVPEYGPTTAGLALAASLLLFFLVTGPYDPDVAWFAGGSAGARAILSGELWRAVTALTLHADVAHVTANALSCAIFATAVCRSLGPGLGGVLMLLAGVGGNLLNALVQEGHHHSVGASTALFGAIGILAGMQFARKRRGRSRELRAWVPLAGALALLAMLGTGARSDLFAHLFGLLFGAGLGALLGFRQARPAGTLTQIALAAGSVGLIVGVWLIALR